MQGGECVVCECVRVTDVRRGHSLIDVAVQCDIYTPFDFKYLNLESRFSYMVI